MTTEPTRQNGEVLDEEFAESIVNEELAESIVDEELAESIVDEVHETSWSANLERDVFADDRERLVGAALVAVANTAPGNHVNLVMHGAHGDPTEYLEPELSEAFPAAGIEYVDQCGCGGHVLRVHRPEATP